MTEVTEENLGEYTPTPTTSRKKPTLSMSGHPKLKHKNNSSSSSPRSGSLIKIYFTEQGNEKDSEPILTQK